MAESLSPTSLADRPSAACTLTEDGHPERFSTTGTMSYRITIEPGGRAFDAEPGETILAAAARHGIVLPYGCRNGMCGSCRGRLLSGEVAYGAGLPQALTEAEREAGDALFCQAVPLSDVVIGARVVESVANIPVRTLPCRVDTRERLAHDVMRLSLKLPKGDRLQYLAGQYVEFLLQDGRKRAFSIANAPHLDAGLELHLRRVPGGYFTDYVFERMKEKALLRMRGPLGTFFLREDSDRPIVLVGGGTGFAPLKAILEHAFYVGITRPMHLFWGVRARRDLYLAELPQGWARAQPSFSFTPVLSDPLPEDHWDAETGFVHESVLRHYSDLAGLDVYMSGPPAMISAARIAFGRHGLDTERLYFDAFEYGAQTDTVARG
jgi:CDP-4-dehydro-6-deoxyglucose reductase